MLRNRCVVNSPVNEAVAPEYRDMVYNAYRQNMLRSFLRWKDGTFKKKRRMKKMQIQELSAQNDTDESSMHTGQQKLPGNVDRRETSGRWAHHIRPRVGVRLANGDSQVGVVVLIVRR